MTAPAPTDDRHDVRATPAAIQRMQVRQLRHQAAALMECARVDAHRGLRHTAAREQAIACAYLDLAHDLDGGGLLW